MAGAMSTSEIGISLAEMIRAGNVHALSVTGANLEEDVFNLVANSKYRRIPEYRDLTRAEEQALHDAGMNRVTDTCIPEEAAIRLVAGPLLELYQEAEQAGVKMAPHEYFYKLLLTGRLEEYYEIDPRNSWLFAAAERNLPIVTPGWEDSTCGNIIVSYKIQNDIKSYPIKSGLEQMEDLVAWYSQTQEDSDIGFFQLGGGIAGDFPICAVPLIRQDLERDCKLWGYFAQFCDGNTSYGGYSAGNR